MTAKLAVTGENYRLHISSFELGNSLRLGNMTYDSTRVKCNYLMWPVDVLKFLLLSISVPL